MINDKNRSNLDTTIEEVKQEFRSHHQQLLVKRKDLITRLGNAFESVVSNPESVCKKIKNSLRDEIRDKIISARDIERYCPDKWKKETKAKKDDNLSFSDKQVKGKPQQQIAVTQDGKSVMMNYTSSNTQPSACINQLHDQSKQNGTNNDGNNNSESHIPIANVGNTVSCNESVKPSTDVDNFTPTHTVEKLSSHPSDKQEYSHLFEFTIPKEKYVMVRDAMDKSKASIFVKFHENRNFLRADPDMFDNSAAKHQDKNVQQIQSTV